DSLDEIAYQGYVTIDDDGLTYFAGDQVISVDSLALQHSLLVAAINADATQTTLRTNAATAASQATAAATAIAINADGLDLQQSLRVILAAVAGTSEDANTTEPKFLAIDGSKVRITGTIDADRNR